MGLTTTDFQFASPPVKKPKNLEQFRRIVEGHDANAFMDYIKDNDRRLFQFTNKICHDKFTAREVLQGSYTKILELQTAHLTNPDVAFCKEPENFNNWVHSIVKYDAYLQNKLDGRMPPCEYYDTACDFPVDGGFGQNFPLDPDMYAMPSMSGFEDPLAQILRWERRLSIEIATKQLQEDAKKKQKLQTLLSFGEGLSYIEISVKQDIAIGTVKSRISNARKAFPEFSCVLENV